MEARTQDRTGFRIIEITEPVFYSKTTVVLGVDSWAGIASFFIQEGIIYDDEINLTKKFGGMTILNDELAYMFLPAIDLKDPESMKVFIHEAFHATHYTMEACGQLNDAEGGSESHAYFIGFLISQIWTDIISTAGLAD